MSDKPQHKTKNDEEPLVISIDDLEEFESPPPVVFGHDDEIEDIDNDIE